MEVSVQEADFDTGAEIAALTAGGADAGAVASFVGLVRGGKEDGLSAMTLEHYPGMTEQALEEIVAEAKRRWALLGVRVIHRVGRLVPGDRIVLVAVSSAHRREAFEACEFVMDYLKTRAPFWKKETMGEGTAESGRWVDARESDDAAARRWAAEG